VPTWGEILLEVQESARQRQGNPDFDGIRRKYLAQLHQHTNRDVILYSSDWLGGSQGPVSITLEDMQGMMEVNKGLDGPNLDLILHSPGGSAEATASIVTYLRKKYSHVRVFVPVAAMSAATMWALSGDEIVMGKHSQLGPIDPQMITAQGQQFPARAIIEQFERAKRECSEDPSALAAWLPILQQYGPALLEQAEQAESLARRLVGEWLEQYMFAGESDAQGKAARVADWFADYKTHQSHALGIDRDQAKAHGVVVTDLEADGLLQDLVLSVHHATLHTFSGLAVKIVENHLGKAFVQLSQVMQLQAPVQAPVPILPGAVPVPPSIVPPVT
jgi:ATP-dependent protease ClpP protease subunit